jgi:hypothetical protein
MYEAQIQTALRLIARKGKIVVWRKLAETVDSLKPWKQSADAANNVDVNVSMVFLPVSRVGQEYVRFATGGDIPEGSLYGLIGSQSFMLTLDDAKECLKDVVIDGLKEYRIKNISPIAPNGNVIIAYVEFEI